MLGLPDEEVLMEGNIFFEYISVINGAGAVDRRDVLLFGCF